MKQKLNWVGIEVTVSVSVELIIDFRFNQRDESIPLL